MYQSRQSRVGTIVSLGAVPANALNIYTNPLSALVLDVKTKRWVTVVIGGVVGVALSILGGINFERFYEDFLLILAYWITPLARDLKSGSNLAFTQCTRIEQQTQHTVSVVVPTARD